MKTYFLLFTIGIFLLAGCSEKNTFIGKESHLRFTYTVDIPSKTVQFKNTSTDNFSRFRWSLGDGTSSTETSPTHAYRREGTYNIRLMGYNADAEGDQEYTQEIIVGEATGTNADLILNQPSNLDFAGFTLTWTKQNIPNDVTIIRLLLSDDANFSNILQQVDIKDLTEFTFKDLEAKKSYWYKAQVSYPIGNKTVHFESKKMNITTSDFYFPTSTIAIEDTANDLDVMHFRIHINEPSSTNLVAKSITNKELKVYSTDFTALPVNGLENTFIKEPYTLFTIEYSATYEKKSFTIKQSQIYADLFFGKHDDNSLWKGIFTKKTSNNLQTALEVGTENGKRLVFQLLNYTANEGESYTLIPTNETTLNTESTVYYLDGTTNDKYFLLTTDVMLKIYRVTDDAYFFRLERSNGSPTLKFKQANSIASPKEMILKELIFVIKK